MIKNCLRRFLNEFVVITALQYGFRNKKRTVDAIFELTEQIVENLEDNVGSVCTLIDLAKAFDAVNHKILLEKCELYGLRGKVVYFLRSYLENRIQ